MAGDGNLDLDARTVRIRAAHVERSTGETLLGPPESQAGRRAVGVSDAIIPALRDHLVVLVLDKPGALVFPGTGSGTRWPGWGTTASEPR